MRCVNLQGTVCGGERHFENIVLLKLGYEF